MAKKKRSERRPSVHVQFKRSSPKPAIVDNFTVYDESMEEIRQRFAGAKIKESNREPKP